MRRQARWAVALVLVLPVSGCEKREDAMAALRTAAAHGPRPFAGRLCGFAWTPSGRSGAATLELRGPAGRVIEGLEKTTTAEALHHTAVAHLMVGRVDVAIDTLEESLRRQPRNARAWSDLAAAIHATGRAERFSAALAAADRAIELDRRLPEAHFNRAVVLHGLGFLQASAREAAAYYAFDAHSQWAAELRRHELPKRLMAASEFSDALYCALADSCCARDAAPLLRLVRAQPRDARAWAESPLLAEWGKEVLRGDERAAAARLEDVRAVARAVVQVNDEHLAEDTVAAIDRAGAPERRGLAAASMRYTAGRELLSVKPAEAERELRAAAELFASNGSPMARAARYSAATAIADSKPESARAEFATLARSVDRRRHRALAAQIDWSLGRREAFAGAWGLALEHLEQSRGVFEKLGESLYVGMVAGTIAECYDRLGELEQGWRHRVVVLADLSRVDTFGRLAAVTAGAIRAEVLRKEYEGALALTRVAAEDETSQSPAMAATVLANRAHVLFLARGAKEALRAVHEARVFHAGITDPRIRTNAEANLDLIEGTIHRSHDPRQAAELLTRTIRHFRDAPTLFLPAAHVERGRARRLLGDLEAARADFHRALEIRESERKNASPEHLPLFDVYTDAINELIDLDLRMEQPERAFATVERIRARAIVERLGIDPAQAALADVVRAALPPRTVLIEYAVLPDRLVVFTLGQDGLKVSASPVAQADLKALTARWIDALHKPAADVRGLAGDRSKMFEHLIRPIASRLAGAELLVFVPDRFLCAVPFAALYDGSTGRYLIESHRVVVSPSATIMTRPRMDAATGAGLVVGDPTTTGDADGLMYARREAEAVAIIHGGEPPLVGSAATVARFIAQAPRSSWIHYAGHARTVADASWLALAGSDGGLSAAEIARMKLPQTRLVVLAACGTLTGRADRVEGMPSLSRAFLAAGAGTVIGTLWDVDDRLSRRFFRQFHRYWRDGVSPSAALQRVQCEFLRSGDPSLRHPLAWGAVQQLGRD